MKFLGQLFNLSWLFFLTQIRSEEEEYFETCALVSYRALCFLHHITIFETFNRPHTYGQMFFGKWKDAVSGQQCGYQP